MKNSTQWHIQGPLELLKLLTNWKLSHTLFETQFLLAFLHCRTSRSQVILCDFYKQWRAISQEQMPPTPEDGPRVPFMLGWSNGKRNWIFLFFSSWQSFQGSKNMPWKPREMKNRLKVWKDYCSGKNFARQNLIIVPQEA